MLTITIILFWLFLLIPIQSNGQVIIKGKMQLGSGSVSPVPTASASHSINADTPGTIVFVSDTAGKLVFYFERASRYTSPITAQNIETL